MFLNNYWKLRALFENHPRVYANDYNHILGYLTGAKNIGNTSPNLYVSTTYSTNILRNFTDVAAQAGKQDRLLTVDNSVLLATGDHVISADDYTVGGTDITNQIQNLSLTSAVNSEDGGETFVFTITGTYAGSSPVEIKRVGITKSLQYNSSTDVSIGTVYKTPFLLIEHELESPIALNQGDPINIILKVTQE